MDPTDSLHNRPILRTKKQWARKDGKPVITTVSQRLNLGQQMWETKVPALLGLQGYG